MSAPPLSHELSQPLVCSLNVQCKTRGRGRKPKILKSKKDTIGLRVPDHNITHAIAAELGHPILSSSLPGDMVEEYTDPEYIHDKFEKLVDLVIDGGIGGMEYSTIVDMTEEEPVVIRQGIGMIE